MLPKIIGFDLAKPDSERTVIQTNARGGGKTAVMNRVVEKCLDAGQTVVVITPESYEVRGAAVAKDVTPKMKLIEHK